MERCRRRSTQPHVSRPKTAAKIITGYSDHKKNSYNPRPCGHQRNLRGTVGSGGISADRRETFLVFSDKSTRKKKHIVLFRESRRIGDIFLLGESCSQPCLLEKHSFRPLFVIHHWFTLEWNRGEASHSGTAHSPTGRKLSYRRGVRGPGLNAAILTGG